MVVVETLDISFIKGEKKKSWAVSAVRGVIKERVVINLRPANHHSATSFV